MFLRTGARYRIQVRTPCPVDAGPAVLALFRSRWGEVDGYLPVLYRLKEQHPDWRVLAMLLGAGLAERASEQEFLHGELARVADVLIEPQGAATPAQYSPPPLRGWRAWLEELLPGGSARTVLALLESEQVRVVLKDQVAEDEFMRALENKCHPRWLIYPHGTGLYLERNEGSARPPRKLLADAVMVGHPEEIPTFERLLETGKPLAIHAIGHPRYDPWWMDHLLAAPAFQHSEEARRARQFRRVFLFTTRGPSGKILPEPVFEYLVRSTARVVFESPDTFLLIKPHPRQDLAVLGDLMAEWPRERWMISSLQTIQLASLADLVISMVSGVILDALAAGKPVIEFFQYAAGEEFFLKDKDGRVASAYRVLGLVAPADREADLRARVGEYVKGGASCAWREEQIAAVESFFRPGQASALRAVQIVEQLVS